MLLRDEDGSRLYTIASHGYDTEGIGSEIQVGEGIIGMAAARAEPMRIGNLGKMLAYARSIRRAYEESGVEAPGHEIPLPGLAEAQSQVAVPAIVLGQLVGVLVIESRAARRVHGRRRSVAHDRRDDGRERDRDRLGPERAEADVDAPSATSDACGVGAPRPRRRGAVLRGRRQHVPRRRLPHQGRRRPHPVGAARANERDGSEDFTNKEVRLDPTLELPEFRDNLESRLILLKRRLDERVGADPDREDRAGPVPPLGRDWTRARAGLVRSPRWPTPRASNASAETSDVDLTGRVVIVTGASRGIGKGLAIGLAAMGAKVVCAARTVDKHPDGLPGTIHETVARIEEAGGRALAVRCDIGIAEDIQHLIDTTIDEYDRIDVLVNNAMAPTRAAFAESTVDQWDESMRVNVRSLYLICRAVVPHMAATGGGSIINISSGGAGHESTPFMPPGYTIYTVAKAAMERFSTALAPELVDQGIAMQRAAARRGEDRAVGVRAGRGPRLEWLEDARSGRARRRYLSAPANWGYTGRVLDSTQFGAVWP